MAYFLVRKLDIFAHCLSFSVDGRNGSYSFVILLFILLHNYVEQRFGGGSVSYLLRLYGFEIEENAEKYDFEGF